MKKSENYCDINGLMDQFNFFHVFTEEEKAEMVDLKNHILYFKDND
jgi:hypothetical protein